MNHYLQGIAGSTGLRHTVTLAQAERLSNTQSLQLFRIIQEACAGVIRHAAAKNISIVGAVAGDRFNLVIEDDGVGVDQSKQRVVAIAMIGIRERAALLDGDAAIGPRAKGGIRFDIRIPLQPKGPS